MIPLAQPNMAKLGCHIHHKNEEIGKIQRRGFYIFWVSHRLLWPILELQWGWSHLSQDCLPHSRYPRHVAGGGMLMDSILIPWQHMSRLLQCHVLLTPLHVANDTHCFRKLRVYRAQGESAENGKPGTAWILKCIMRCSQFQQPSAPSHFSNVGIDQYPKLRIGLWRWALPTFFTYFEWSYVGGAWRVWSWCTVSFLTQEWLHSDLCLIPAPDQPSGRTERQAAAMFPFFWAVKPFNVLAPTERQDLGNAHFSGVISVM